MHAKPILLLAHLTTAALLLLTACAGGDSQAGPGPGGGLDAGTAGDSGTGGEGEGEGEAVTGEGEGEGEGEGPAEGEGEGPAEGEGEGEAPCETPEDCPDRPCADESCVDGACVWSDVPGCCVEDDDCGPDGVCDVRIDVCAEPTPAGAVIVNELMLLPAAVGRHAGVWIELLNPGVAPVDLYDWTLVDASGDSWSFGRDAPPLLGARAHLVLGLSDDRAANGDVPVDVVYDGVDLDPAGDELSLLDAFGGAVDVVAWDDGWPVEAGASLSLSSDAADARDNDDPLRWCPGVAPWADGADRGTPGEPNPACPEPPATVDWCRFQHPMDAEAVAGGELFAYGRVYEEGVTDVTERMDRFEGLVAEAGVGPDGSHPAEDGGWEWFPAGPNAGWNGRSEDELDNDEYMAALVVPGAGEYDLAFRFSMDDSVTWVVCDGAAGPGRDGSEDGYSPDHAGALTVLPDPCDEAACDTPPDPVCQDDFVVADHVSPGVCTVVGGLPRCTYAERLVDCRDEGLVCAEGACVPGEALPMVGEIIFTEVLYDTGEPLEDTRAEWFELHNTTGEALRLDDCTVGDAVRAVPVGRLVIQPGGYALFAASDDPAVNGNLSPDHLFDLRLNNGEETLTLACHDLVIDAVAYDNGPLFPHGEAASISLDPEAYDAALNDLGESWCLGEPVYWGDPNAGTAHRGTPGAANPLCPRPDLEVDWCRLQHPVEHTATRGSELTVFGRVWDEGVTDLTPGVDEDDALVAQLGIGPRDSDPDGHAEWVWHDAVGNPAWNGEAMAEPNNDEYMVTVPLPDPGDYDFAYRFSLDGGETWRYCDRDMGEDRDGSQDGYQVADAGKLTSEPGPCEVLVCDIAPAPECEDGLTVITHAGPGVCEVQDGQGVCVFGVERTDCSLAGGVCDGGACVGGLARPAEGEVVVTEILYDPDVDLHEGEAEWFEVLNLAAEPRTLHGCVVGDGQDNVEEVVGVNLEPGDVALFASTADEALNGGLVPDAVFGFALNNPGDTVLLRCGDIVVDEVTYDDGGAFPDAHKVSLRLDPGAFDAVANDDGANWCLGENVYYGGPDDPSAHRGTPGWDNPPCPDFAVNWCRLQHPETHLGEPAEPFEVFGRVWEPGITDRTEVNDPDPALGGEVGYGPHGSDPRQDGGWLWFMAEPNPGYVPPVDELENDEYVGTFPLPEPGLYDYAYRFTLDAGQSWLYCDLESADPGSDGSEDGYQVDHAGQLLVEAPDPCEGIVCQEPPGNGCLSDTLLGVYSSPGECQVEDGDPVCVYEPEEVDCASMGMVCDVDECVVVIPPPAEGELVITEILYQTVGDLMDGSAEWFELVNVTDGPRSLDGCVVSDDGGHSTDVVGLTVEAGAPVLFARSLDQGVNGGLLAHHRFTFGLNNDGDTVQLTCGDVTVDQVAYGAGEGFPVAVGASLRLDPGAFDATLNDDGESWCLGETLYYGDPDSAGSNYGTPGTDNPPCEDTTVDWCRLQHPLEWEQAEGTPLQAYGRVYEEGITDWSDEVDVDPRLVGELGWGPPTDDPGAAPDWEWVPAEPNPQWVAGPDELNNDEYQAFMTVPGPGEWDFAFRFSLSGGEWLYCDRDRRPEGPDGSEDGYLHDDAGHLTSLADPCADVSCDVAPAAECLPDGLSLLEHLAPGECVVEMEEGVCQFETDETDCLLSGQVCRDGACVFPPPEPGVVVITEVLYAPAEPLADGDAEWFEVVNVGAGPVSLDGCVIGDSLSSEAVADGVVLEAGGFALFARSADPADNGGLEPDDTFGFGLNDGGDTVVVSCEEQVVDSVTYDDGPVFPEARGASIQLDPHARDAALNDDGSRWCLGTLPYWTDPVGGESHLGTPGLDNEQCPSPGVDWCRLQDPLDPEVLVGEVLTVYGRVHEAGITDLTPGVDAGDLLAEIGLGPATDDPGDDPDWLWQEAVPNTGWHDVEYGEPGNDEYMAVVPALAGTWDFAFRFSLDGETWLYCDRDRRDDGGADGSVDGYESVDAGHLVAVGGPCDPDPCVDRPVPPPTCDEDGTTVLSFLPPALCWLSDGMPSCAYQTHETDCAADEQVCVAGECVVEPVTPAPGDLVITEVLYDPVAPLLDGTAEWFEVKNVAGGPVILDGCTVGDAALLDDGGVDVAGGLILEAGELALFGRSDDAALFGDRAPDSTFAFALNNGAETLWVACGGVIVDEVVYDDGGDWPDAAGASIQLDVERLDAAANDLPGNWCLGEPEYHAGNLGTPGEENHACDRARVDWCRLQHPVDVTVQVGEPVVVYGRVWEPGLTNRSRGNDVDGMVGQAGYGPATDTPGAHPDWVWVDAEPNEGWNAPDVEADNDEYQATVWVPVEDTFDLAFRFSLNGGADWLDCDRDMRDFGGDDGSADEYHAADAGNLVVEGGPCADNPCVLPPGPGCLDDTTLISSVSPGDCTVVDGEPDCVYPTVETDCAADGAVCRDGECVVLGRTPVVGEVVITEIVYDTANPDPIPEPDGEWFEVKNVSADALSLAGCSIADGGNTEPVEGVVTLLPGEYALFGGSDDAAFFGGVVPDDTFGFSLNNNGDTVSLSCGDDVIDEVTYDDLPDFPNARAASISLDPAATDAAANDDGANWCLGQDVYFEHADEPHLGTPRAENPVCPDVTVDWCRLQDPRDREVQVAESWDVYGEVLEEGLTDLTPGVDLDGLRGQAGFGPPTADPGAAGAGWTWVAAVPNPAWNNAVNDEYMAPLSVPEAGTYDFAFRYTLDDGFTWLYCDTDRRSDGGADGSADGYQQANAGHVVVEGGPCEDDPCAVPPAPECAVDGVTLITYLPGACSIDGEGHACDWPSTEWDCSAAEGACDGGVCVGGLPNPDWGEVVITEIMYDPHTGLVEGESEWFEVKNVGGRRVSLDTCVVGDSSSVVEVAGVNLDPGALGLFASSDAPAPGTAIVPDHLFGFSLSNNGDAVHVTCGETLVDQVAYDDGPVFPNARQASLNLDPTAEHALANDDGVDWCLGATPYWGDPGAGSEHLGTPGEDNPSCVWVDWCRLQSPSDQQMTTADTVTVYGRVYEEGLTDGGPGVDAHDDLRAQVGYGAATARPWAAADWTWVAAAANPGWNGPDAGEDHNDEYEAELAELPEGDYDVAYRFSLDGGVSWRYCDRDRRADGGDDGSADGYQQADAGTLSVLPAE